jgi:nucleoside-diphosphate kinase
MRTLAIIKPDAVAKNAIGFCLQVAEIQGLRIERLKWIHMTEAVAGAFYIEHFGKPFYEKLVKFMSSGPCVVAVLAGAEENTFEVWREAMKGIRSVEADPDRSERNAVHGSDSIASAIREMSFFFSEPELDEIVQGALPAEEIEDYCLDCGSPVAGGHGDCQNT